MNKAIQKLSTTLVPALNKLSSKGKQPRRRPRRERRRRAAAGAALPAAYATHVRSRFSMSSRDRNTVIVKGVDLVYPIPNSIVETDDTSAAKLFTVITCNPSYWLGTRVAAVASVYQNYRPLQMSFHYIPQVAVTQPGTVFMGTFWHGAASSSDLQQSLVTSNGGLLTQCYIPADTTIRLKTNLPYNLYNVTGDLNSQSNPFIFCAGVAGSNVVPGYFYVSYTFEFKNPLGETWTFYRSDVEDASTALQNGDQNHQNIVVLNNTTPSNPAGTLLDKEQLNSGTWGYYKDGTQQSLSPGTRVVRFASSILRTLAGAAAALVLNRIGVMFSNGAQDNSSALTVSDSVELRLAKLDQDSITLQPGQALVRADPLPALKAPTTTLTAARASYPNEYLMSVLYQRSGTSTPQTIYPTSLYQVIDFNLDIPSNYGWYNWGLFDGDDLIIASEQGTNTTGLTSAFYVSVDSALLGIPFTATD